MPNLFFIKDIKKSNSSCNSFDGKKKYIATADLQNGKIVNYEVVDFSSKPSRANLIADNGSVIFAKMQNTIKVLEIDNSNVDNIYSTGFYSFKDERVLPSYMKFFFESTLFNTIKDKNCQGATMKAINDEGMSKISINVPSIQIQQKIIDELSKITELIDFNKNNLVNLDNIVKSQFIEMFENKGFELVPIRELVDTKKISAKKNFNSEEEIKYIDISSIDNERNIIIGYTNYIMKDAPSRAQQCLRKNDILISTVRPNLRNIAIFKEEDLDYVGSSGFCILRAKKVNSDYLKYVVLNDKFTNAMVDLTTGASYPAIRDEDVLNYLMINAPLELQNTFADFVQQIDKSKFIVQKQIKLLEELLEKKMNEYFGQ